MQKLILNSPRITLGLILLGITTTLIYDFSNELAFNEPLKWIAFSLALPFRVFTYVVLFISCGIVALRLNSGTYRTTTLIIFWSIAGLSLAVLMWGVLSSDPNIGQGEVIKRFTPDTLAHFAPGWTMAEVAISKDAAVRYSWKSALGFEAIAIVATSIITALFLFIIGATKRNLLAYFAPIVAMCVLMIYDHYLAPWSYTSDFDEFFGDALIGTMISNAGPFFLLTLIFGGFTAPAVWVSLITFVNVALITWWGQEPTSARAATPSPV